MAPAPVPTPDLLAQLRIQLAILAGTKSRAEGTRIAEAIEAAGIEISDDEGRYLDADELVEKLGGPSHSTCIQFAEGYWLALERGYGPHDPGLSEIERDGAQTFLDVREGLRFALESHQWREFAAVPSDMLAKRVA